LLILVVFTTYLDVSCLSPKQEQNAYKVHPTSGKYMVEDI